MMLKAEHIGVTVGGKRILTDISFSVAEGEWLMLAGPNGAGKSTLIHAVSGGMKYEGTVTVGGKDLHTMKPAQIACEMGVLAQMNSVSYAYTVRQIVELGRYARSRGMLAREQNERAVEEALQSTGLAEMADRNVLTLSGGELQRTFLAQLLAQDPKILILDEPANHLDLVYQERLFSLVQEWLKKGGRCVISVVHDLSLAKFYGTKALLMKEGKCIACGECGDTLKDENLEKAYDMDVGTYMRKLLGRWKEN